MKRSYRKTAVCLCMLLWGLTACAPRENSGEQNGVLGAEVNNADAGNAEDRTENTGNVGNATDETNNTANETGNAESRTDSAGGGSGSRQSAATDASNSDILAACAGMTITQTMETSDGKCIVIDAEVMVEGISRVSRYRYIPQTLTEEDRKALFRKKFPAETWDVNAAAVYDEKEDSWQFVSPIKERWIYRVNDSGTFGEQILDLERIDIKMDYEKEMAIYPVRITDELTMEEVELSDEIAGAVPREVEQLGQHIIDTVTEADTYTCSYIHLCGVGSEHPYAKAVFKQTMDGMPVTVWHNIAMATAKRSIFPVKVWGAFFSAEEIGLDKPILSAEEAVDAMREQIDTIQIQETQISVSRITLEYLSVLSPEGGPEIVPVWRFQAGEDEMERNRMSESILAVNAASGELIWEKRGVFTEQL